MSFSTPADLTDINQYVALETHLMNVLERNALLPSVDRPLTPGNITEINDTITSIQNNLQTMIAAAAFLDVTPPTVANLFPADGDTNVPVNSDLVLTFNEPVQKGTGNILIRENGVTIQTIDVTSGSVTVNNHIVTINPANFGNSVTVSVQIAPGAIKDLTNNAYTGITNDTTWNFSTAAP